MPGTKLLEGSLEEGGGNWVPAPWRGSFSLEEPGQGGGQRKPVARFPPRGKWAPTEKRSQVENLNVRWESNFPLFLNALIKVGFDFQRKKKKKTCFDVWLERVQSISCPQFQVRPSFIIL